MTAGSIVSSTRARWPRAFAAEMFALPRWAGALGLLLLIAGWALVAPRGGAGAVLVSTLFAIVVVAIAWTVAEPAERPWVVVVALFAILGRQLLVGAIDVALASRGLQAYAPDENVYIGRAAAIWHHWLQPAAPFDDGDSYNRFWYVHAMARLYLVFGEDLVIVKLLNTFMAVSAALLGYRAMRNLGMPGRRWALVLLVVFPSTVLWSALALKDAWVAFFLILSLWAASEFVRGRNYVWLPIAFLALVPIETVRLYMLVTGTIALLAVPFAVSRLRDRLVSATLVLAGGYLMFAVVQPFAFLGPNVFYIPIELRSNAANGARSAFVEPRPAIRGDPGEEFQVALPAGPTAAPGVTPRVVEVQPGTEIVVRPSASAVATSAATLAPDSSPTPAVVRPGDIVVIVTPPPTAPAASAAPTSAATAPAPTSAATAPAPTHLASPKVAVLDPEAKNTVGLAGPDPDETSIEGSLETNVRHLPLGMLYTLFAPFPWTARTLEQLATIPEMFLWYACLILALIGFLALLRRRDLRYGHGVAMIVGLVVVLSLIGANVGTLVRSRAMLIPYVLLLSGVGIDAVLRRYPRLIPARSRE